MCLTGAAGVGCSVAAIGRRWLVQLDEAMLAEQRSWPHCLVIKADTAISAFEMAWN